MYLLIQAFMLGVHTVIEALIYIRLAPSLGTNDVYYRVVLQSHRNSISAGFFAFGAFSAAGIYFLRGGRFLMRWLQYIPGLRTDADAQTIRPHLTEQEARNMSVNQRLSASGLFHEFADAVDRRNVSDIERILRQIDLTPEEIQTVIAQMLPTSA